MTNYSLARLRLTVADLVTPLLLRVIGWLNWSKDEHLSLRLHKMADDYARRPTGEWR